MLFNAWSATAFRPNCAPRSRLGQKPLLVPKKMSVHLLGKAIDPSTSLKCGIALDWTDSSVFAPLPLRKRLLVNQAVYFNVRGSLYLPGVCF